MQDFSKMSAEQLLEQKKIIAEQYSEFKARNLKLDMSRGKPGAEQLDLSLPMLDAVSSSAVLKTENGTDVRNYGVLDGIEEAKVLFSDLIDVATDEIIIMGSSSLTIMFDTVSRAMSHGVLGSDRPWNKEEKVKFLCPVPGYDRHFTITEFFGIEMINIPMDENGPDMDMVEKLVSSDPAIKGIWCVPKYSNPSGGVYSEEVVKRFAALKPAAKDFRIFWDNAYCVHYVYKNVEITNILEECKKNGTEDMVFIFGSTSKLTFPGAGVGFFAASKNNINFVKKQISAQAIGWDKINMLRHVYFFKNKDGVLAHMENHAKLLRPRFDAVLNTFESELGGKGLGTWIKADGGYFITYVAPNGCAKRIVELCKEAGVVLTGAGATHPYGKDPDDSMIRIAPSFPSVEELQTAVSLFCICVKLAAVEKFLG